MGEKLCAWLSEISRHDVPLVGGKGANLGDMARANLPIPPGFVVTAPAYRQMIEKTGLGPKIEAQLAGLDREVNQQLQQVEAQIRHLFEQVPVFGELSETIVTCYRQLGDNVPVAVRSSATAEDLAGASFAGQQETFLNVVGEAALLEAVRRCWASLFTAQAIFYRSQRGFVDTQVSMAVVVQRMINAEKSGVCFTVDPVMRNYYQMVIEGVWGLGEGIVSGAITPDHYKIDRETYEIIYEFVPDKKMMYCRAGEGGVRVEPVPPEKVSARILTEAELRHLVDLGRHLEAHFGCPQDIEWGTEEDRLYLLQSRPITNL